VYVTSQLIQFRKSQGLTQNELAKKIHVSRQTVSHWENGRTYPDIQSLLLLAELYDVDVNDLISGDLQTMRGNLLQKKIRWLIVGVLLCGLFTYGALASMRWLPAGISMMLVASFATLGVVLSVILINRTNSLKLYTYRQILTYLKTGEISHAKPRSRRHRLVLILLAALLGVIIGAALSLLIGINFLHWSLL
jgi:transcriptional regulator with XRE-family HTH domain